jgi:predicted protein tyrosine phosphatase
MMNRIHTAGNPYQGPFKRVLCVCSAGLLRSPTAALVLSQEPFNFNTRAAGCQDYALVRVDDVLIHWADEIVVMEPIHLNKLLFDFPIEKLGKQVKTLYIKDDYPYRAPDLMKLIAERYQEAA